MPYLDKSKQREYTRKWMADRRASWLAQNGPCKQCGSWERLEVHHRDRSQKSSHRVWSWSEPKRLAELAKCDVLCHACHKEETKAQLRRPLTHGTKAGYNRGCRCDECRAAAIRTNKACQERAQRSGRKLFGPRMVKCTACSLDISYLGNGRPPIYCSTCKAERAA